MRYRKDSRKELSISVLSMLADEAAAYSDWMSLFVQTDNPTFSTLIPARHLAGSHRSQDSF